MKTTKKQLLFAAAMMGAVAGFPIAAHAEEAPAPAEKQGCQGKDKDGCQGKEKASCKGHAKDKAKKAGDKEKMACGGKDGCGGKDEAAKDKKI